MTAIPCFMTEDANEKATLYIKSQDVSFPTSTMDTRSYTNFSIASAKYIYNKVHWNMATLEERQRKISATYTSVALLYEIYLHVVDILNMGSNKSKRELLSRSIPVIFPRRKHPITNCCS
ncbi:uncharacterized protein LOC117603762 [Osmia lignaria lignaria]|uniref:uncharacterized protein LOC117603762 n=1 Tax=Osmia lignaria lignaria TaxID=1437193 RepID=UPI00402B88DF